MLRSVQVLIAALGVVAVFGRSRIERRSTCRKQPHIIFIMADDLGLEFPQCVISTRNGSDRNRLERIHLTSTRFVSEKVIAELMAGWADVSFHGSRQIPTPNLDTLAADGVVLNNYYVHPTCTASRSALMTGLYCIRYGLQHEPIQPGQPYGLSLNYTLLPQHLRRLGYQTHLIGKWHLGGHSNEYTPTWRGFDTFFGLHYGHGDYFTHMIHASNDENITGLDLWKGMRPVRTAAGKYSTDLYADEAVQLIKSLDTSKSQFLYLSHQAPHSGNNDNPLEAPKKNIKKFPYIGEKNRTIYAGMVDALDQAVGRVMTALSEAGMLENSVIVFSSDNGGVPWGHLATRGINWPLRGTKGSPWEGGCRAAGFIWSPLIDKARRVSQRLMHITDWLPTFYALAGGSVSDLGQLDGQDIWAALSKDEPSPRREVVYNIDPDSNFAGIRKDRYKIVVGATPDAMLDDRYTIPGDPRPWHDLDTLMEQSSTAKVLQELYGSRNLSFASDWRTHSSVRCRQESCGDDSCFHSSDNVYLFDLEEDPCECNNLASTHKKLLESLNKTLEQYRAVTLTVQVPDVDPEAYPWHHKGTWAPWLP